MTNPCGVGIIPAGTGLAAGTLFADAEVDPNPALTPVFAPTPAGEGKDIELPPPPPTPTPTPAPMPPAPMPPPLPPLLLGGASKGEDPPLMPPTGVAAKASAALLLLDGPTTGCTGFLGGAALTPGAVGGPPPPESPAESLLNTELGAANAKTSDAFTSFFEELRVTWPGAGALNKSVAPAAAVAEGLGFS